MSSNSKGMKTLKWILNMSDDTEKKQKTATSADENQGRNSWDSVLASAGKTSSSQSHAAEEPTPLWQTASVRSGGKSSDSMLKKLMRWAVIFLLILFTWIGLRTAIWGNNDSSQQQAQLPLSAQYPQEQAAGIAQRFATAFLTFEEGKEEERAKALSPYYSGGEASGKLGWDGKGKQSAANAVVLSVEPISDEKARVIVLADVTSYDKGKATGTKPVALEMSVSVSEKGAAVYGNPAYVGLPNPPEVAAENTESFDTDLAQQTKESAQEFFTAYANNDTLDSVTAPGAHIVGLNGAVKNPVLTKWNVGSGSDTERTAWATVTYQTNGSTVTNTYQLALVKVSGGESAKWQIKEIKGSEI